LLVCVVQQDLFAHFRDFVARTHEASGVTHFIVHARKVILSLNTRANRSVPPLKVVLYH
jgi:tRNA-dihydrouridine synthase A